MPDIELIENKGTINISVDPVKEITNVDLVANTPKLENNPFTNGLKTKAAWVRDANGRMLNELRPEIDISTGNVTINPGVIPYSNLTIVCLGA